MSKKSFIDSVEVGSPCSEDWNQMRGTDKIRLCSHCTKHVNNLSEMTRKEAARLVRSSNGNICIRYIADPVTRRPIFAEQLFQITRRTPGIAAGVMTASLSLSALAHAQESAKPPFDPVVVQTNENKERPLVKQGEISVPKPEPTPIVDVKPIITEPVALGGVMVSVEYRLPLSKAVANENIDEARDLIVTGANVNGKDGNYSKITPLFLAVESGNLEITEMLLNYGAKVNARDAEKQTPLMRLDGDATPELVELLVRHGVKINLTDNEGNTAIILAADGAKPEVLKALIDAGADVRLGNKQGQTALMNAVSNGDIESVRLLIQAGADVTAKNKDGDTVLNHASADEIRTLLISYGAEAQKPDNDDPSDN